MKVKGEGRTRLTRFAAITIPAGVATAGMGFAMLQGMVGSALASTDPFTMAGGVSATSLVTRAGALQHATSQTDETAVAKESIYAETVGTATTSTVSITSSPVSILGITNIKLKLDLASGTSLGTVGLNAATMNLGNGGTLGNVNVGVAQYNKFTTTDGLDATQGYRPGGFAVSAGATDLPNLNASVYQISLTSLATNGVSIAVTTA